jgi:hypothetical protein
MGHSAELALRLGPLHIISPLCRIWLSTASHCTEFCQILWATVQNRLELVQISCNHWQFFYVLVAMCPMVIFTCAKFSYVQRAIAQNVLKRYGPQHRIFCYVLWATVQNSVKCYGPLCRIIDHNADSHEFI